MSHYVQEYSRAEDHTLRTVTDQCLMNENSIFDSRIGVAISMSALQSVPKILSLLVSQIFEAVFDSS